MSYLVQLCVRYKDGVLNPEASAIQEGTQQLGFGIEQLVWGRYCSYVSSQPTKKDAEKEARDLCETLFANPVMETYQVLSVKRMLKKKG